MPTAQDDAACLASVKHALHHPHLHQVGNTVLIITAASLLNAVMPLINASPALGAAMVAVIVV